MADVELIKKDNVFMKVICDRGIAVELNEEMSFFVPGYKFMPKYKNKMWDGKIYLLNLRTREMYNGLVYKVHKFCKANGYTLKVDPALVDFDELDVDQVETYFNEFVNTEEFEIRDYQLQSIVDCIKFKRKLLLSPTSSGKSLVIYMITRILQDMYEAKVLITCTSTGLVEQMTEDFWSYQKPEEEKLNINRIYSGKKFDPEADIVVTTWQSAYKKDPEWFDQFDVIISDEAHAYKANCLKDMLEKTKASPFKFGFTGTLDEAISNKLTLEGLFGPVVNLISTKELIERGYIADIKIYALIFEYDEEARKKLRNFKDGKKATYQEEIEWIVTNENRNKAIINLLKKLKGNSLTLFQYVEKHGQVLYDKLSAEKDNVFFIHGGADIEYRVNAKKVTEESDDADLIASYGTFQQGESVKRLHNLILGSPSKSKIRVLQSLGRGLRKGRDKTSISAFDIVDDLSIGKYENYAKAHFKKRHEYYMKEGFEVKFVKVKI